MWTGEDGEHKNEEEAIQKVYYHCKLFDTFLALDLFAGKIW